MSMRMVDVVCTVCGHEWETLIRNIYEPAYPYCCGRMAERLYRSPAAIRKDSIEGGLVIEHGLCNEDGTPRTYYSQSEITAECKRRGLIRWTDIHSEDKTKDARVRADWYQSSEAKRAKAQRDEARAEQRLERERQRAMMR